MKPSHQVTGSESPHASIVVVTRDRCDELRRALRSCLIQKGDPEIIVIDDASADESSEMVRKEFPSIHLFTADTPRGYIVQRNIAAGLAKGAFLFYLDDDAEFSSPDVVDQTLEDFRNQPEVAAVAIPYTEPPSYERIFQSAPDAGLCWVCPQFVGTACAVRRSIFLDLGGFDESLVHQGEERDFCIRLLDLGFHVRIGSSEVIVHHRSAHRDFRRMAYYGRRNDILFNWKNTPFPQILFRITGTVFVGVWHSLRCGELGAGLKGVIAAVDEIFRGAARIPVRRMTHDAHRQLRKRGMLPIGQCE